jgi:hypothetical protein
MTDSRLAVIFVCPKCGQPYRATQQRYSYERPGRFDCIKCNAQVHEWRGVFDFTNWQAVVSGGSADQALSEPHYEVLAADDGMFTVKIHAGEGAHGSVTQFGSREEAVEWVREQRRKLWN